MGLIRTVFTLTLLAGIAAAAFLIAEVLCEGEEEAAEGAEPSTG